MFILCDMYYKFFDYLIIVNSYFDSYRYVLEISHVYDVCGKIQQYSDF